MHLLQKDILIVEPDPDPKPDLSDRIKTPFYSRNEEPDEPVPNVTRPQLPRETDAASVISAIDVASTISATDVASAQIVQQDAIRAARLVRQRSEAEALAKDLSEVEKAISRIEQQQRLMQTNELGMRIASSDALVTEYQRILDAERPTPSRIKALDTQLDALAKPLDAANSIDLTEEYRSEFDRLATEIRSLSNQVNQHQRALQTLASACRKHPTANVSLHTAIHQLAERKAQAKLQAEAEYKQRQQQAQLERDRRRQAAADKAKREQERLMQEALSPQVLAVLAPLTTHDYTQPKMVTGGMATGERTATKGPVSFSRLQSLGVLDPTESGLKKMAILNAWDWTRRPRYGTKYEAPEPSLWSEKQFELIRLTQEYLNKYGPILVQTGKLAP